MRVLARRFLLARIAVISLVIWPFTPGLAASLQVTTAANASAFASNEFAQLPDFQNGFASGATGPVYSSTVADRGAAARFAVGHAVAFATLDLGYFAGKVDSLAMSPLGFITTDGTNREFGYYGSSSASLQAVSQDQILVTPAHPWLIGTLATVVVPVDVSGTLSATLSAPPGGRVGGDSLAQVIWSVFVDAGTGLTPGGILYGTVDTLGTSFGDMPGPRALTFDLQLGVPTFLSLNYSLHSSAFVRGSVGIGGRAHGVAALDSTIRWMGISQVLDAEGNPIEYSLTSDSGFDWTQAAPTPIPLAPLPLPLLTAVLASGALFARRCSRL